MRQRQKRSIAKVGTASTEDLLEVLRHRAMRQKKREDNADTSGGASADASDDPVEAVAPVVENPDDDE